LKVEDFLTFHKWRKRVAFLRRPFRNWRLKKSKCLTKPTTRRAMKKKDIQHPIEPLSVNELREAEIWLLRRDETKAYVSRRKLLSLKNSKLAWEKRRQGRCWSQNRLRYILFLRSRTTKVWYAWVDVSKDHLYHMIVDIRLFCEKDRI
jgi:Cu2+-containing amine oxidase